ncbi:MAG: MFS transporter [Candidatus Omnitrophota bacterium]
MNKITFAILCLEGAVLSFNVAATAALIPSIAVDFGLSQFFVGKIIWLYMLPYGISALLYGPLIRLISAKKIELFCILFFSLANLFAASAKNIYILFAARFLMGVFGASIIPLALILIARHIGNKNRGKFVGLFFSTTFIASLAGLLLSGIINWRLIYLIPALAGFATCFLIYFYLPAFREDATGFKINYLAALKNKTVAGIFTYIFIISLLYHGVQQWLGVYFSKRLGLEQFMVSMLITLTSLSGIFGEVIGGHLADIIGRAKTIKLGIIFMILTVFCLIFKISAMFGAVIMVIWGLGWTLNHAAVSTVLTDLPKKFLNEAASLNSSVRFISGGLGAALSGIIMQKSFSAGFLILGLFLTLLALFSKKIFIRAIQEK